MTNFEYGPDFIGIGATKGGTSWLFDRLSELDEFDMPVRKEIGYFDRFTNWTYKNSPLANTWLFDRLFDYRWVRTAIGNTIRSVRHKKLFLFYLNWYFSNYNDNWYLDLLNSSKGISGDITPAYSLLEDSDIKKMYNLVPLARLVFIIRNPVERAWSQYRMMHRSIENTHSIIAYMKQADQEKRSDYINILERYLKYYPKEQVLLAFYDAIHEQPLELLSNIVRFLGGDPKFIENQCNLTEKTNVSRVFEMPASVKSYLNERYDKDCEVLAGMFGGYCNEWHQKNQFMQISREEVPPAVHLL